jgi:hypothetical protein
LQVIAKHAVVVALEHDPVFTRRDAVAQEIDDAAAVGAPVDQIADMDHRSRPMFGDVGFDPGVDFHEQVEVAVDIADGVGSHLLLSMAKAGGFHTPRTPCGIFAPR